LQEYQAQDLMMQLEKLANQVRFITMIIKKELIVSGRKKAEILRDLKSKDFKQFFKVANSAEEENEKEPTEEEEDVSDGPDHGYDYLLTVVPSSSVANSVADLQPHDGKSGETDGPTQEEGSGTSRLSETHR
jgi:DNA topoisomerase II